MVKSTAAHYRTGVNLRYNDFKIVETKLREANEVYVIGDSHARAMGGSNNLAANGARLSAISQQASRVPNNAIVYMTGGHNDVAGGAQPQAIASQVSSIINSLTQKGCVVTYILFPEGSSNTNQEQMAPTRQAIAAAVPVGQDLDGCSMQGDGIHCQLNAYRGIVQNSATSTDSPEQSDIESLSMGPPYPPEEREAVASIQRKLEELYYSVGNTGIDGKYGPRTARAVRAYRRDRNITDPNRGREIDAAGLEALMGAERTETVSATGNTREFDPETGQRSTATQQAYTPDYDDVDTEDARQVAEAYLGESLTDQEWQLLLRATAAEANTNRGEMASCMAVMLNRVRSTGFPDDVRSVLYATNQFEAVTGHGGNGSAQFRNPSRSKINQVMQDVIANLADVDTTWVNFTSNIPSAYSSRRGLAFRQRMLDGPGNEVIGDTIFGIAPPARV